MTDRVHYQLRNENQSQLSHDGLSKAAVETIGNKPVEEDDMYFPPPTIRTEQQHILLSDELRAH